MKIIVKENERGLLFKDGNFVRMLTPGRYRFFRSGMRVDKQAIDGAFDARGYDLSIFARDTELKKQLAVADVPDEMAALHYINGKYADCLVSGRYAFWNIYDKHEFRLTDMREPEVGEDIPRYICDRIPLELIRKVEVAPYQKALLFVNQKLIKLLDEGTYYFWNNGARIDVKLADTRLLQMEITGQEMLTQDKVTLRVNFICRYRIADTVRIFTEIDDYEEQMHVTLQLALREVIGQYRLDEILENKERIAAFALQRLKEREGEFFVAVADAGIKDIILPGEIRAIMNTVLVAEKTAQANVITRREEVASTRSLLNTARLMEENQTLYKLKELEYLQKICENVGSISVTGGGDLLAQLTKILKGA